MTSKEALDKIVYDFNETITGMNGLGEIIVGNLLIKSYKEELGIIQKDLERLEKLEKALKIIINKNLNAKLFVECLENHKEKYKKEMSFKEIGFRLCFASNLTKKEFELLKGVLCNA